MAPVGETRDDDVDGFQENRVSCSRVGLRPGRDVKPAVAWVFGILFGLVLELVTAAEGSSTAWMDSHEGIRGSD